MDAARELYAKDPVPQLTILAGKLAERVKVLEEQTKYLISKRFLGDRGDNRGDFVFAVKYGDVGSILEAVRKGFVAFGEIKQYLPLIRERKDAEVVIKNLQQFDKTLKGGKTHRRKLKQRKQTRRQ